MITTEMGLAVADLQLKLHPTQPMAHGVHIEVPRNFPCGLQSLDWKTGPEKVMTVYSSPIGQVNGLAAEGMLAIG
jgi:hypothetical protein